MADLIARSRAPARADDRCLRSAHPVAGTSPRAGAFGPPDERRGRAGRAGLGSLPPRRDHPACRGIRTRAPPVAGDLLIDDEVRAVDPPPRCRAAGGRVGGQPRSLGRTPRLGGGGHRHPRGVPGTSVAIARSGDVRGRRAHDHPRVSRHPRSVGPLAALLVAVAALSGCAAAGGSDGSDRRCLRRRLPPGRRSIPTVTPTTISTWPSGAAAASPTGWPPRPSTLETLRGRESGRSPRGPLRRCRRRSRGLHPVWPAASRRRPRRPHPLCGRPQAHQGTPRGRQGGAFREHFYAVESRGVNLVYRVIDGLKSSTFQSVRPVIGPMEDLQQWAVQEAKWLDRLPGTSVLRARAARLATWRGSGGAGDPPRIPPATRQAKLTRGWCAADPRPAGRSGWPKSASSDWARRAATDARHARTPRRVSGERRAGILSDMMRAMNEEEQTWVEDVARRASTRSFWTAGRYGAQPLLLPRRLWVRNGSASASIARPDGVPERDATRFASRLAPRSTIMRPGASTWAEGEA